MTDRAWTPQPLEELPEPKKPDLTGDATSGQIIGRPQPGSEDGTQAAVGNKRKRTETTTLTYWNGRGLCESIRFMLAFTSEDYEESVPGFDVAAHLAEPEHMQHLRGAGMLLWNQVPLLCIDGLQLVQSKATVRYLAEKHNVRGSTPAGEP